MPALDRDIALVRPAAAEFAHRADLTAPGSPLTKSLGNALFRLPVTADYRAPPTKSS